MKRYCVLTLHGALLLIVSAMLYGSAQAQGFENCVTNGGDNASIVFPSTVKTSAVSVDTQLEAGDEIGVFTRNGTCAGKSVWQGDEPLVIAAAGADGYSGQDGFSAGDTLYYRLWKQATGTTYEAHISYEACMTSCENAASYTYYPDAFYIVSEVETGAHLPVELVAFEAQLDGSEVLLQWSTAGETNNVGFEVQHRAPVGSSMADGTASWRALAFVEGQGTVSEAQAYHHRTEGLGPGTHHFRLKQIDYDGAFEYSSEVEVTVEMAEAYELSAPHPNPFRSQAAFALRLAREQQVELVLYDQLGRQVRVLHAGSLGSKQRHRFTLEGSELSSGVYFIRARGEHFTATERVILMQ